MADVHSQVDLELSRDGMSQKRYTYRPLKPNKSEIRLIKIQPPPFYMSSPHTPLQYTIKHFSLQNAPTYKAVSYRWGERLKSRTIPVNDSYLDISDNLYDFFLQGFQAHLHAKPASESDKAWLDSDFSKVERQWASHPWLWIDQLCIDQSSIEEKNHQVAQMGLIYARAIEVLVWLGNGLDGTSEAVRIASFDLGRGRKPENLKRELHAFQKIVANQYWTRLWIIQEFVLARAVVIMSGTQQVSGAAFRELARDVAQSDNSQAIARIWPFMIARRRLTTAYMMGRMAYSASAGPPQAPELQYTWLDVLKLAKKAECKDVRDRVYGMLSMVRQQVRIEVDYLASAEFIRERIVEREFKAQFDEIYSVEAFEELRDDDFEKFLGGLDEALELDGGRISYQQRNEGRK